MVFVSRFFSDYFHFSQELWCIPGFFFRKFSYVKLFGNFWDILFNATPGDDGQFITSIATEAMQQLQTTWNFSP